MIIKVFKDTSSPLVPKIVEENIWLVHIELELGSVKLSIFEDHEALRINVDGQIIIEPCASNSVRIKEQNF